MRHAQRKLVCSDPFSSQKTVPTETTTKKNTRKMEMKTTAPSTFNRLTDQKCHVGSSTTAAIQNELSKEMFDIAANSPTRSRLPGVLSPAGKPEEVTRTEGDDDQTSHFSLPAQRSSASWTFEGYEEADRRVLKRPKRRTRKTLPPGSRMSRSRRADHPQPEACQGQRESSGRE